MTHRRIPYGISIAVLLSALVIIQPIPTRAAAGFIEQALLGTAVGTIAGVTVAKIEEKLENKEGEVPVGHRFWLWPTAWFARRMLGDRIAELAGYTHLEFVPFIDKIALLPNDEFSWPACIAAWASWFAMRELRASKREETRKETGETSA